MGLYMEKNRRKRALIVDDAKINRVMLHDMLVDEMDVIEASGGREGIDILKKHLDDIDVVLLDLVMPDIDGFDVLRDMKAEHMIDYVPVIMITSENSNENMEKAYDLGALDFIARPFSERLVRRRVITTASLFNKQRELADRIDRHYKAEDNVIDDLTGLYFKKNYIQKVDTMIKNMRLTGSEIWMVAIDVDHFKLFNNYYEWEKGDEYLSAIGHYLKNLEQRQGGLAGYLGGDDFAILMPGRMDVIDQMAKDMTDMIREKRYEMTFRPNFGIYKLEYPDSAAVQAYDRAVIALSTIKGDYSRNIAFYDNTMVQRARDEYQLLIDIQRGIKNNEFTFFIQPKCDLKTGKVVGGEALARWVHPEKGLVSPGVFIPVLEKNGLVSTVDRIVWDRLAAWQRKRIDMGCVPVPISVNVSRTDIFTLDVVEFFTDLLDKYNIPSSLIEIEITESAFSDDYDKIASTITRLHQAGFLILMDDFGSGYSSLNSLKDLDIDVLKIDMKFLKIDKSNRRKGVGILESVINLAQNLNLPTIAEGVEESDQVSILRDLGCGYSQGYYYYKPLPVDQFEKLLDNSDKADLSGKYVI